METLAPSILEIRNSFLEKFKNEKLDAISKKLTELFDVEKDPVKKLVLLASRVETVRKRINEIHQDESKTKIINISFKDIKPRKIPNSIARVDAPFGHFDESGYKEVGNLIIKQLINLD